MTISTPRRDLKKKKGSLFGGPPGFGKWNKWTDALSRRSFRFFFYFGGIFLVKRGLADEGTMEGDMYAKGTIRVHLLCRSGDGYSLMLHRPALMALIPLCFLCRSASSPQTRKSFLKAFKRSKNTHCFCIWDVEFWNVCRDATVQVNWILCRSTRHVLTLWLYANVPGQFCFKWIDILFIL